VEDDYHPELANYEPHVRQERSPRRLFVLRTLVVLAIIALVLPGVVTTISFGQANANRACQIWVSYEISSQSTAVVHFEFAGHDGIGWECYAVTAAGEEHVAYLGPIAGVPTLPNGRPVPTS
jgi:hypothetical protein